MSGPAVECYSGHTYAQEPRAVIWEGRRQPVAEIEARWRTPTGPVFRVRTESGNRFELDYHESEDRWSITKLPGYQVAAYPSREDKEVQD
jgi:hypothetical protein